MTNEYFSQFLKTNVPIADVAGVTLKSFTNIEAQTEVSLSFMTQNPFKSMFWAVQGMAAELSTGVLCITKVGESNENISILVVREEADFTKKAVGTITFTCNQGKEIDEIIQKAIESKEGQTITLKSTGRDEENDIVATFYFTWSFKLRQP